MVTSRFHYLEIFPPHMSALWLLAIGMMIVVGGILVLRLHVFLALILGAMTVALLTPEFALQRVMETRVSRGELTAKAAAKLVGKPAAGRVAEEFGRTCANLGILIAMATILGQAMLLSGAAEAIAVAMLRCVGAARAHWAFFATSFLLCIPVMLDTVMYLLAPLFKAVARRTGRDYLLLVMCTVAGGTITHSLVPPTPGPLFVAGELGVPLGLMICMGSGIGLCAALAGVCFALWSNQHHSLAVPIDESVLPGEVHPLPALWLSLLPVLLPIGLVGLDATLSPTLAGLEGLSGFAWALKTVGDKDMALTLGALVALIPLLGRREDSSKAVRSALSEGAMILLIIGAGGAFGGVLQQTGIASELAASFRGAQIWSLPMVFLVTALVRTAQGSATVAMITAAPIAKALIISGTAIHPVYFAMAIGCGSKPFAWMNDAGFWIITRLSGMREAQTLRTVSPMMAIQGVVGLLITMLVAWLFPMSR